MNQYHKIPTVYLRDPETKFRTLLEGQFASPELAYLAELEWEFSEKLDGTNIRVTIQDGELHYGGKTDNAQIPTRLLAALEKIFRPQLEKMCSKFPGGVCLYGEGIGVGIHKGGKHRPDNGFVLFDVKIEQWWLQRDAIEEIATTLGLEVAPIIGKGTLPELIEMVRQGFKSRWGDFLAEGIVARPAVPLFSRKGDRIITKLKHRDFLVVGGRSDTS